MSRVEGLVGTHDLASIDIDGHGDLGNARAAPALRHAFLISPGKLISAEISNIGFPIARGLRKREVANIDRLGSVLVTHEDVIPVFSSAVNQKSSGG